MDQIINSLILKICEDNEKVINLLIRVALQWQKIIKTFCLLLNLGAGYNETYRKANYFEDVITNFNVLTCCEGSISLLCCYSSI